MPDGTLDRRVRVGYGLGSVATGTFGTVPGLMLLPYLTDTLGDRAVSYVEQHASEPFFLYLAFNAAHTPMEAPEKYLARFPNIADPQRRTYAAMVSAMDDAIGRTLAAVRDQKLEEKTLVIFLNDNGGPTMPTTTVNGSSNGPLRGSKRQTWEGGHSRRVRDVVEGTPRHGTSG